jgi:hypothetical protein
VAAPASGYVTMLAAQGVHERVAQQLASHADGRITRVTCGTKWWAAQGSNL